MSAGSTLFLDEFSTSTPSQTVPRQSAVMVSGCTMAISYAQGMASSAPDGGSTFFTCSAGTTNRVVVRVLPNGTADWSTVFVTSVSRAVN